MEKNNMLSKFAFTFIEIMVVISIISIVSFTSVFYFNDFIDSQEIKGILHNFSSQVELFDAETEQGKIYDYEVFLWKGSFFAYSLNNYKKERVFFSNLNYNSSNISLKVNWGAWNPWSLKIYGDEKIQENQYLDITNIYTKDISKFKNYSFDSSLSWEIVNELWISYYSIDNISNKEEKKVILSFINSEENKGGTSFSWVIIKNKNNIKEIFWDGQKLEKIFLFFRRWEKESYLEINAW